MADGIRVPDVGTVPSADSFLVVYSGTAGLLTSTALATMLASTGAVAEKLELIEAQVVNGLITKASWTALLSISPSDDGAGAEVLPSDGGTHLQATATGYNGASVNNAGRYSWNLTWGRWERVGDSGYVTLELDLQADILGTASMNLHSSSGDGDNTALLVPTGYHASGLTNGQMVQWVHRGANSVTTPVITVNSVPYTLVKADGSALKVGDLTNRLYTGRVSGGTVRIANAQTADDLPEGASNLFLTDAERTRIAEGPVTAPATEDWIERVLDVTSREIRGTKKDRSEWEAQDGKLRRVTEGGIGKRVEPSHSGAVEQVRDINERIVSQELDTGQKQRAIDGSLRDMLAERGLGRLRPQSYDFNPTTGVYFLSDIDYLFLILGQSLAEGSNSDASDGPVTTAPEHPGAALMPATGVGRDTNGWFDEYVDLYEIRGGDTGTKETVCSGMADAIMRRMSAELGYKPRMIWATAARGGVAYYGHASATDGGMKIGSDPFSWMLETVRNAREVSGRAGRQLVVAGVVIIHGEQDTNEGTTVEEYRRALQLWQKTGEEEMMRLTGQAKRPQWYLTQTNRPAAANAVTAEPRICRAQFDAGTTEQNIRLIGATYFQEDCGDHSHPTARSYRRMGGMIGNAVFDDLFGPYHVPLHIVDAWQVDATTFRARFTKDVALETDDSRITISTLPGGGLGLHFDDRSGAPPTVTSISVVGGSGDTVEFTLSSAPSGFQNRILVANHATGTGPGKDTGPRSGIRSAASFDTDPQDSYAHYWWACTQMFDF